MRNINYISCKSEDILYLLRLNGFNFELVKTDAVRGLLLDTYSGILSKEELKEIKSFDSSSFKICVVENNIKYNGRQ